MAQEKDTSWYPEEEEEQEQPSVIKPQKEVQQKDTSWYPDEQEGFFEEEEEEEEIVGSKREEPFWKPFADQALGVAISSYSKVRPVDRILKRTTVKTAEDLYNTVNEVIPLGSELKWEQEYLGKPETVVEDVTSNMLSWLVSFAVPGGAAVKGVTVVTKAPKIAKAVKTTETILESSKAGKKALQGTRIALEGFMKGAVADYIRTDVQDLEEEDRISARLSELYEGALIGAGVNFGIAGVKKIVGTSLNKIRALKEVRKASEGKAEPEKAVQEFKKAIDEEEALKRNLEKEIDPVDEKLGLKPEEIKADEPVFYHGTKSKFEKFSVGGQDNDGMFRKYGPGVYLMDGKNKGQDAKRFAGEEGDIVETTITGNIANKDEYLKAKAEVDAEKPEIDEPIFDDISGEPVLDEAGKPKTRKTKEFTGLTADNKAVQDKLKAQGFDGLNVDGEVVVFDPKNVNIKKRTKASEFGKEPEAPKKPKLNPEDEIEQIIAGKENFPQQVQAMLRETVKLSNRMSPKVTDLISSLKSLENGIQKGSVTNITTEFDKVKQSIINIEDDLRRNRKMLDVRARVGNVAGKLLAAFRKKKLNLTNPMVYKPAVRKQLNNLDSLLKLIGDVKGGKSGGSNLIKNFKKEVDLIEEIEKTGNLSEALDKSFNITVDDSVSNIWGSYKKRISDHVLKTIRVSSPKNKAALELFSNRVTTTLNNAVKGNKPIAKKIKTALDDVKDIVKNPEKYKESIDVIIADINKAKNLEPTLASRALNVLEDLKNGVNSKRFIDSLPNRDKVVQKILKEEIDNIGKRIRDAVKYGKEKELVEEVMADLSSRIKDLSRVEKKVLLNTIRVELSNTISSVRDAALSNFASKEIYQQYSLHQKIKDLDEMSEKSLAEIKEFLKTESRSIQADPEGIKTLKREARASRKVLTDQLKNEETAAKRLFMKEFLTAYREMGRHGVTETANLELVLRSLEKYRMATGFLMSPRTWTLGIPSGVIMSVAQPLQRAMKTYVTIKEGQRLGRVNREVKALQVALEDIKSTTVYLTSFTDALEVLKQTFKQRGEGSFMSNNLKRHEEDLVSAADDLTSNPKINFKDRKELEKLYKTYGIDTSENAGRLRRFLEDVSTGDPSTKLGKMLDPLFTLSFKAMAIPDQAFTFMGAMRNLRAESVKDGMIKGLSGESLEKFVEERAKEALVKEGDILKWADNEEFEDIKQLALSLSFQQDYADKYISKLAQTWAKWSRTGGRGDTYLNTFFDDPYINPAKIVGRLMTAFIKTPTAIAQWTVDTFPGTAIPYWVNSLRGATSWDLGLKKVQAKIDEVTKAITVKPITKELKEDLMQQRLDLLQEKDDLILKRIEVKAEATSNMMLGLTITAGTVHAIAAGRITGSGAHLTKEQKDRMMEDGWMPNTIYFPGGLTVNYGKFEPVATVISAFADGVHYSLSSKDDDFLESENMKGLFSTVFSSFVTNFKDKYFLRGMKEMFDLLDEKQVEGKLTNFFAQFLGGFIPRPLRELSTVNEEYQKYAIGFIEKLKLKAGLDTQRIERNSLGEKVKRKYTNSGLWGMVSPTFISTDKKDPVFREIAKFRDEVAIGNYHSKKVEFGSIDIRQFRNKSDDYPLFQAYSDLLSKKKKETVIEGETQYLKLRDALGKLFKTKEYKEALTYGEPLEGELTKKGLIKSMVNEYRNHFWKQMKEDSRYRNYVNEDGKSWTSFLKQEEQITPKSRKLKRIKTLVELNRPPD
jgi:hypothetical protein